ncbi:MAG TPA: hypothetical protein DFS52_09515 [Myxococcales bacterium]|nr:hypothetical protein [Myxococcales bacterium]
MRRTSILGVVLATLAVAGCAGTKEAAREVEAATPGLSQTREGIVTATGPDRTIQVYTPNAQQDPTLTLRQVSGTSISRDGQQIGWAEIQPGEVVRVSFTPATGAEEALKVEVLTGSEADDVRQQLGIAQPPQQQQQQQPGSGGPNP